MKAVKLKTEYLKNPLGIDIKNPRFMWNCEGGKAQSAYRLIASDTRGNILWDSGKVEFPQMTFIQYPLDTPSRLRVNWKVKLWDENGLEGDWSEPAFFEIGLRNASDWSAKWITGNYNVRAERKSCRSPFGSREKDLMPYGTDGTAKTRLNVRKI